MAKLKMEDNEEEEVPTRRPRSQKKIMSDDQINTALSEFSFFFSQAKFSNVVL